MRQGFPYFIFGFLVSLSCVLAHPNPEIALVQERMAGEKFNATLEELGISVGDAEVLLRSDKVGYAIRKPLASPDGKWIAFTNPEQDVLAVLDLTAREVQTVTAGSGVGTDYLWNGSSGELLYRKQKEKQRQGGYEVWCRNFIDDSHEMQLSVGGPVRLVPVRETGEVLVTDAEGRLMTRTSESLPDEQLLPIVDLRGQVLRLHVGEKPDVLNDEDEQCFDVQHAPSGDRFVYSDLDTLKLRTLSGEPAGEFGYGIHPRWAPDGSCLIYQLTFDDGHSVVKSELAVSSPDGSRQAQLTSTETFDEAEPCWMPDGKALLCACEKTGNLLRIAFTKSMTPAVQGEP